MNLTAELATTIHKSKAAWRELVYETARTGVEPALAAIQRAAGSGEPADLVERFREDVELVSDHEMSRAAQQRCLARMQQIAAAGNPYEVAQQAEAAALEAKRRLIEYNSLVEAAALPGRRANHIEEKRPDLFDADA